MRPQSQQQRQPPPSLSPCLSVWRLQEGRVRSQGDSQGSRTPAMGSGLAVEWQRAAAAGYEGAWSVSWAGRLPSSPGWCLAGGRGGFGLRWGRLERLSQL